MSDFETVSVGTMKRLAELDKKLFLVAGLLLQAKQQEKMTYGMDDLCADIFRQRKVFSLIDECIKELEK
jgi:hypothetical protein